MFRLTAALVTGLAALPIALATPAMAMASTATPVSMTFDEPVLENVNSDCPAFGLPNGGFCGNGVVVPYGHATEMIAFGVACGGGCDVRTVTLSSGSIVMDEYATGGACFGACAGPRSPALTVRRELNAWFRGDLIGDGASVAGHGGRGRVDLVDQQC